jgi:putative oxidoreductase
MLSIMRIVVALLFMEHGSARLFDFPHSPHPTPHPFSLMLLAGILEFFGGFLVLIGLLTRPVTLILAGEMAVAYFMDHAPRGFWPIVNRGELAVLYCFVFLYLAAAGGGTWTVAQLWRRSA